jgi:signal transduction histidine kinase
MRERLALCGGRLEAGATASGGWRVLATIPTAVRDDSRAESERAS